MNQQFQVVSFCTKYIFLYYEYQLTIGLFPIPYVMLPIFLIHNAICSSYGVLSGVYYLLIVN